MAIKIIAALWLGLAVAATAPAAGSAGKNPVLDLSRLIQTGEWASTTTIRVNGKPQPPEKDESCIGLAELHDYLNSLDPVSTLRIRTYRLDGNRLHLTAAWMTGGKKAGTVEYYMIFDDRDASHGRMTVVMTGKSGLTTTMMITAHRIGACTRWR